ncbi:SCO family protein [Streptomyces sp. TRM 70351]|uniref:SCO family protein n=1 Tax=Streptomyces sp. TRM 70351 TaxID=3116552 RepID=UPI002E7B9553|nr:SCO family protein [Streptomyces sp. TRM 70351]MEE1929946.1 SCO family protein [Streptomyces sp. TRM 70351]
MHHSPHARTRRRATSVLALAAVLALGATACGGSAGPASGDQPVAEVSGATDREQGTVLDRPFEKPDLVLTGTDGQEYDFVTETRGKPTLLYFGYTHCPDICPLTMGNIAVAESKLTPEEREELQVVFVTTDPERDTPEELGAWLKGVAPGAVGLTGDFATIQAGARTLGISIDPPEKTADGEIVSTHGSQVLFFSPEDDKAHVLYTEDVPEATYARDLPKLVEGELP